MNKLTAAIHSIFAPSNESSVSTTQMRMGSDTTQVAGMRFVQRIPLFGHKSFNEQYKTLLWTLIPVSFLTVAAVLSASVMTSYNSQRIETSTQLQMLSQRVARLAAQVSTGDLAAADGLRASKDLIGANIGVLELGRAGLRHTTGPAAGILKTYKDSWVTDNSDATTLLLNAEDLSGLRDSLMFIQESADASIDILAKIRALDVQNGTSFAQSSLTEALGASLSEASKMAETIQNSVTVPDDAIAVLTRASQVSASTIEVMLSGSTAYSMPAATNTAVVDRLISLRAMLSAFGSNNSVLINQLNKAREAKVAAASLVKHAEDRLKIAQKLTVAYDQDRTAISLAYTLSVIAALLSLAIGFFWIWLKLQETRLNASRIDESVMELMTDMMEVSDGNLTVRTRVAENITGSIADSLNLTVAVLNKTMSAVKDSSNQVRNGAKKIHEEAALIHSAVATQAEKIQGASTSVNSIEDSVQAVAFAAEQSADVAKDQLQATDDGRRAVENVIASMDNIRDQIQDTAKRLKLLGEKTQSIDEIIDLIAESTEKTNVLAMNASIQAAAAGEHGRGFRAVATEVQRLAEHQEVRLKEIVAMVRSNQSTASNAIASMEMTTQFVVDGTKVANEAGEALRKIESVSGDLSQLIQAITEATAQQRGEAANIAGAIKDILGIADNTAKGVEQAALDIADISGMASDLDETMKQFKLS
jgi:twitching motility protein PilJ